MVYAKPFALVIRDGSNRVRRFATADAALRAARELPSCWALFHEPTSTGGGHLIESR